MTEFQRARSEEQREARRRAVLDTAAAMLDEMPVAKVSLNEISRRVGLAKSNVLRYFESREAIFLELLDRERKAWLSDLGERLAGRPPEGPLDERVADLAEVVAAAFTAHATFCDLHGEQAAVLEKNISPEVAARYKRASLGDVTAFADLLRLRVPELDEATAVRLAGGVLLNAAASWVHSQPSEAMKQAYAADPALAVMRIEFTEAIRDLTRVLTTGALALQRP
ncbi:MULTISPECIES: TetR/AcrR family transcriptional regulator [unclassified Nocardiopsis]|uniref:TetR/AcrR family transcriptional regulator n=1 Tax=Nocardiopsis TaxID=2013 RepID=UPI00387AA801